MQRVRRWKFSVRTNISRMTKLKCSANYVWMENTTRGGGKDETQSDACADRSPNVLSCSRHEQNIRYNYLSPWKSKKRWDCQTFHTPNAILAKFKVMKTSFGASTPTHGSLKSSKTAEESKGKKKIIMFLHLNKIKNGSIDAIPWRTLKRETILALLPREKSWLNVKRWK